MARPKHPSRKVSRATAAAKLAPAPSDAAPEEQILQRAVAARAVRAQTRQMLDRTDLDEEQKQNILVAMSCPCCGAGAMSFTAKLKR